MGNVVVKICGGEPVPKFQKVGLSFSRFTVRTNSLDQLKTILEDVVANEDPDAKLPWKGQLTPTPIFGMYDEESNKYNSLALYDSVANAEANTQKAGAAFKSMAAVMEGSPNRVIMEGRFLQYSTFSWFDKRTICPAAMSLSVFPLKDGVTKDQFFKVLESFNWSEAQKECLFMGIIIGHFEENGQIYGVTSGVYATVEHAKLINSRGWFKQFISQTSNGCKTNGSSKVNGCHQGQSLMDLVKAVPERAVGEGFVVNV